MIRFFSLLIDTSTPCSVVIDTHMPASYTSSMDIENANDLFDAERLKRKLDPDVDFPEMRSFALREAMVELMVQNNRILWHTAEQQFRQISDDNI